MLVHPLAERLHALGLLNDDGSFTHERGDIIVRRVMHFLAEKEGVNTANVGGPLAAAVGTL